MCPGLVVFIYTNERLVARDEPLWDDVQWPTAGDSRSEYIGFFVNGREQSSMQFMDIFLCS